MKLSKLTLQNFRCFRSQSLDLSADMIAIYGRNGTGKTALYDAIEYCLTGKISRFGDDALGRECLVNAFDDKKSSIRIDFNSGTNEWIETSLTPDGDVVSSRNQTYNRKDFFFQSLVNDDYLPPRREFDPLIELFRSTILLTQSSVRQFIDASSTQRVGLVANLVGAAYYQRCLEKAQKVVAEGRRRLRTKEAELSDIAQQIQEAANQIQERDGRLGALNISIHGASVAFEDILASLPRIDPTNQITPPSDGHAIAELLITLRVFANERLNQVREQLAALSEIKALIPQFNDNLTRRASAMERLDLLRSQSLQASDEERSIEIEIAGGQAIGEQLRIDAERCRNEYDRLTKLNQLLELNQHMTAAESAVRSQLRIFDELESKARNDVAMLETESADAVKEANIATPQLFAARDRVATIERIHSELSGYEERQETLLRLQQHIQLNESQLQAAANRRAELDSQLEILRGKSQDLIRRMGATSTVNSELVEAILKLRAHASDGVCPLCGHSHQTEDALDEQIDLRLSRLAAVTADLQHAAQILDEERNSIRQQLPRFESEESQLRQQGTDIKTSIGAILQSNRALEETALLATVPLERASLEIALTSHRNYTQQLESNLVHAQERAKTLEQRLHELRANLAAQTERASGERSKLVELQSQKAETERQISVYGPASERPDVDIQSTLNRQVAKQSEYETKLAEISSLRALLPAVQERLNAAHTEAAAAEQAVRELTRAVSNMTARLRDLQLSEEVALAEVEERHAASVQKEYELGEFLKLLGNFQGQHERSTAEEERNGLRTQHTALLAGHQELTNERGRIESAIKVAEGWEAELADSVRGAVAQRLNQHRIESFRLFQSMIPSRFLFEDITVSQGSEGVNLGLRYKGVVRNLGEPRYFLSSAQANVLSLSYFLSFATRQRWCKLQTILLDDPVQHLDDLDAVAFLDIVRSLVTSREKKQQVIISTCDYNLYALMIRKFSGLPSNQVRFSALSLHDGGENGPEVQLDFESQFEHQAA